MAFWGLLNVNEIVAAALGSDEAKCAIRNQILAAIEDQALAPRVRESVTHFRSEARAESDQLKGSLRKVSNELAASLAAEAGLLQRKMEGQVEAFLRSPDGKELIAGLLIEALSRIESELLLSDVKARLKEIAKKEIDVLCANAESTVEKSGEDHRARLKREVEVFDAQANEMTRGLIVAALGEAEKRLQDQCDRLIDSSWGEIQRRNDDFVNLLLPRILRKAVDRHVASGPRFAEPHSNRWLAAALGISMRAVKRRRRRGELPDVRY